MMKHILIAILLIFSGLSFGQITVQNTLNPQQLVQNILAGNGVQISNVAINGNTGLGTTVQSNATYFQTNANSLQFPIADGILLTTGMGSGAVGPNSSGSFTQGGTNTVTTDPDLNAIANGSVTNGIVLEFDFIPSGDTLSFKYMFGSDEYPEFSPSTYNDAFGFFISGPGINGPYTNNAENIAIIPNTTTPVTINNVGPGSNAQYYANNLGGAAYANAIQYDGTTTLLTANASVQCGQNYHIKLAISNVGDQSYDSGVFLEASSFSSNTVNIDITTDANVNDSTLVEGCTQGLITFSRPQNQLGDTMVVVYTVGGQAIEGVDYTNLGTNGMVTFLPNEDTVLITIDPFQDGLVEGPELLTIEAYTVSACGDTVYSSGQTYIIDEPFSQVHTSDTTILCDNDSVLAQAYTTEGFEPYTYEWIQLPANTVYTSGDSVYLEAYQNQQNLYIVESTDNCGFVFSDTMEIIVDQSLAIDSILTSPTPCGESTGFVSAYSSGYTGQPNLEWSGPGMNNPNSIDASAWGNLGSGWYYFTVSDDVCLINDSAFVDQENVPTAAFTANPTSGTAPLNVTFTNNSTGGSSYEWNFGNGNGVTVFDLSDQNQTYTDMQEQYQVQLITYGGSCSDTAYTTITVIPFLALNYSIPNVITPDGDNANDLFQFNPVNALEIDLIITNRWGGVVFESYEDPTQAVWDGTNQKSGNACTSGTYFFQVTFRGYQGEEITEQGFIQLVE